MILSEQTECEFVGNGLPHAACTGPQKLLDADLWSAWVSDDAVTTPEVVFTLAGAKTFNLIQLREDIRLLGRILGEVIREQGRDPDDVWRELAAEQSRLEQLGISHLLIPQWAAGTHRIAVRLKDSAGTGGFDYEREQDVKLAPGQILVIDFDAEKGGITLQ